MKTSELLEKGILMYRRARRGRRGRRKQPPMKPTMRFTALLSVLLVSLAACLGIPKSSDDVATTDEAAVRVCLDDLENQLAVTSDATDLVKHLQECLR